MDRTGCLMLGYLQGRWRRRGVLNQIQRIVILSTAGLVLSGVGFALLMAAVVGPWVAAVLLGGGLLSIAAGTLWLAALLVRGETTHGGAKPAAEPPTAMSIASIANGQQLVASLQNFQDRALDLIERRRLIHHLNTRQSHYVHKRETDEEIEANKRYREAGNDLDYQRLTSPTQFWASIDSFRQAVSERVLHEVYSPPSDQEVYDIIGQHQQRALEEINSIAAGFQD